MWELLEWIIEPAAEYFYRIFRADTEPDARKFTLGCFLVFIILVLVLGGIFTTTAAKKRSGSEFYNFGQDPFRFCNKLGRVRSLDFELGTGELV